MSGLNNGSNQGQELNWMLQNEQRSTEHCSPMSYSVGSDETRRNEIFRGKFQSSQHHRAAAYNAGSLTSERLLSLAKSLPNI